MPYKDIEKQRAAQARYYEKNKSRVNNVTRDRRNYVIRFLQEYKTDKACIDCGIEYPYWILDFDHVRGTKIGTIAMMVRTHSLDAIKLEIEKCELVCANCHRHRTYSRKITSGESLPL